MRREIQELIDKVRAQGLKADAHGFTERLIVGPPEHVVVLVEMVLEQLPRAGPYFEEAISFLPEDELPRLARLAVAILSQGGTQETAEAFIAHCSLQQVEALHPLLGEIWKLKPNWDSSFFDWPWRGSGQAHFDLLALAEAWDILLETRDPANLEFCAGQSRQDFLSVGFEGQRQLFPDEVWHFVFPSEKKHPTWSCDQGQRLQFGGPGRHTCAACGNQGHHLISLDLPLGLGVTQRDHLRLETCLSCLGWEVHSLYYRHDVDGKLSPVGYEGGRVVPQFPSPPFQEKEIQLARTPRRWQWQDWGVTNGRQNLHRLGGHPCWIQDADYLVCPQCQSTMSFLFQLDSYPDDGFLWGSGGICYGQWCDRCKVSGYLWQCT